ncbi:MAG: acyl-CoA dehydrogenase family protein [Actinomycetota bacterium]|nr:acyl-CoA dehydrogenase family protein [Actinomycetota bacterium]
MPDFLSDDLVAWRRRARDLAVDHLVALADDDALDTRERGARVGRASKDAGVYELARGGADLPGAGEPALRMLVVREELARHGVGHLPNVFGPGPGLLAGVDEPLRSTHLAPLLDGHKRAGFAFTEPADAPRPTHAHLDGDELVVTGAKSYVTGGADADFLTATVDVEGEGPAMVVIDVDLPGVRITRRFDSYDGSHHAAFAFDEARVPRSHVLGAAGGGRGRALEAISAARRAIVADCVGTTLRVLELVEAHLGTERRDGRRPGDRERARLRYGELRISAYAARSAAYRTARLSDAGENVVNETIAAKVLATEVAGTVADTAVQLVGGEALVVGHPLERIVRRVRTLRLAEGETDTLAINVARGRLDLDLGRI